MSAEQIDAAVAPLRGQTFGAANVRQIPDAIAAAYARSDIALYSIELPGQDFTAGDIRVRVREGAISTVSINGDVEGDVALIRHYAAVLAAERPLTRSRMERELSLISDIPGLETRVGMSGADASGGVRLGLDLERHPREYEIGLNNRGSESLGETQVSAMVARNALFRMGDQTRLILAADTSFQLYNYAAISHRQPIGHDGAAVTANLGVLRTEPEDGLRGRAHSAGVSIAYPWIRSYRRNLTVSASLDGLNSDNAELGGIASTEHTRVARFSTAFVDADARRAWVLGATLSTGIDGLGARTDDLYTDIDFTKLSLQASYSATFWRHYLLRLSAAGQATDDALPASERFTLGGASFGRAFPSAWVSGDQGYGLAAEFTWRVQRGWLSDVYGFVDGGEVSTADRLFAGYDLDLASAGFGTRLRLGEDTRLDLEAAFPVDDAFVNAEEDWRFLFGVSSKL